MSDDLDQLCDDIRARTEALVLEVKRLAQQPRTPEQRAALDQARRRLYQFQLQLRLVLQTGLVQ